MGRWRPASLLFHRIATASKSLISYESCPRKLFLFSPSSIPKYQSLSFRVFSSISSGALADTSEFDLGFRYSGQNHGFEVEKEKEDLGKIPVKAYFLSTRFVISLVFVNLHVACQYFIVPCFFVRYQDLSSFKLMNSHFKIIFLNSWEIICLVRLYLYI